MFGWKPAGGSWWLDTEYTNSVVSSPAELMNNISSLRLEKSLNKLTISREILTQERRQQESGVAWTWPEPAAGGGRLAVVSCQSAQDGREYCADEISMWQVGGSRERRLVWPLTDIKHNTERQSNRKKTWGPLGPHWMSITCGLDCHCRQVFSDPSWNWNYYRQSGQRVTLRIFLLRSIRRWDCVTSSWRWEV